MTLFTYMGVWSDQDILKRDGKKSAAIGAQDTNAQHGPGLFGELRISMLWDSKRECATKRKKKKELRAHEGLAWDRKEAQFCRLRFKVATEAGLGRG